MGKICVTPPQIIEKAADWTLSVNHGLYESFATIAWLRCQAISVAGPMPAVIGQRATYDVSPEDESITEFINVLRGRDNLAHAMHQPTVDRYPRAAQGPFCSEARLTETVWVYCGDKRLAEAGVELVEGMMQQQSHFEERGMSEPVSYTAIRERMTQYYQGRILDLIPAVAEQHPEGFDRLDFTR